MTRRKVLRRDNHGDESLFKPFIFFAAFIAFSGIIIGSMGTLFTHAASGSFDYLTGTAIILGNETYTYIDGATPGYNVTIDDTTDQWLYTDTDPVFVFHDDLNNDDVYLAMIRDFADERWGTDWVGIYESWGWWSDEFDRIQYDTIIDGQVPYTNVSVVDFEIHKKDYVLLVTTPSNYLNHSSYVDANEFFIALAHAPYDPDNIASVSMWTLIGQMLTAQLPSVHPLIQYFILIPMWVGVGFMVFTLVSRMIPFISGG